MPAARPSRRLSRYTRGTSGGTASSPNPARRSDVFVPNSAAADDLLIARDLSESAALDPLLPTLLANYPDAVAISYLSARGLVRAAGAGL